MARQAEYKTASNRDYGPGANTDGSDPYLSTPDVSVETSWEANGMSANASDNGAGAFMGFTRKRPRIFALAFISITILLAVTISLSVAASGKSGNSNSSLSVQETEASSGGVSGEVLDLNGVTEEPFDKEKNSSQLSPSSAPPNIEDVLDNSLVSVSESPTEAPVETSPTKSPNDEPINAPIDVPTDAPIDVPTDAPTNAPTAEPTDAPKMLTILDVQAGLNKWVSLQGGPPLRATQDTVNTLNSVTSSMSLYQQMAFLANAIWESGGLRFTEEQAAVEFPYSTKSNYQRCDWNTNEQASNGKNFYGRGYMQLSWCANYKAYGRDRMVNNDADYFYNNPETVATTYAWDSAAWFFDTNVSDNTGNFGLTTQAINGNLECMSSNNYIGSVPQKRYQIFEALAAQVGLTGYAEGGCYN
jgi:predicted chitinase